ncbi:MAG: signal recognition particle protein [Dehalococcoidia bacterium]|nr:signal recognition particle protein [Dehalococcoidia bacterium]
MLDLLSERLGAIFKKFSNKGSLTEKDIDDVLRQVRLTLLEADVNLKVVKSFTSRVRDRALTANVLSHLSPMQQVIKIVNEELTTLLGSEQSKLVAAGHPPTKIMLVGLQGSGKTTTAAKLALHFKKIGQQPLLVAADTHRPAAIKQLITLGKQVDVTVYSEPPENTPDSICAHSIDKAREIAATWIIADTAGRLQIDQDMMTELENIKRLFQPSEILLVVDAMTGQEAVHVAEEFNARVGLTGLILTKLDGDARGGAALSIKSVTGVPIKFIGLGEKANALEPFHPDRLASRILGMGDTLTLIEKAEQTISKEQAEKLQKKVADASFDLDDFLEQLQSMKKMGSMNQIMDMIPGFSSVAKKLPGNIDDTHIKKIEAIVLSMTPAERHNPDIIDGNRRRRIAQGSGTTRQDVNQLLNQFRQARKIMKQLQKGKKPLGLSMFR